MKRKRLLWAGGILAGLLVGVPVLLWSGYAVLALLRHEHFYHALPSSWWRRQVTLMRPYWDPNRGFFVDGRYFAFTKTLASSRLGPVTDYFGLSTPANTGIALQDPAAAGVLCDLVQDGDAPLRYNSSYLLASMHLCPDVAIPELIRALDHFGNRMGAIQILGRYGPQGTQAVPALLDFLNRESETRDNMPWLEDHAKMERGFAVEALRRIEPENLDMLIGLLKNPHRGVREQVAGILGYEFGPKAKAAVPALLKMRLEWKPPARPIARQALLLIDPEAAFKAGMPKDDE
jgi:hypothetical protein